VELAVIVSVTAADLNDGVRFPLPACVRFEDDTCFTNAPAPI
jgi:hypothetical protein